MSVSAWRAMRGRQLSCSLLAGLLIMTPLRAAEPPAADARQPPHEAVTGLEYQPQPLLDDVFVPSKEISDDYPIPFPVDI